MKWDSMSSLLVDAYRSHFYVVKEKDFIIVDRKLRIIYNLLYINRII